VRFVVRQTRRSSFSDERALASLAQVTRVFRCALPAGRITGLGATPEFRHGLLAALCLTIVAAFQLHAAAATVSEDVPLPGGTAALAKALGIDPVPERGRFIYELTRLLYNTPEGRRSAADAFLLALRQSVARAARGMPQVDTRPAETVPVPLTADLWSSAIFKRKVSPRELIPAILADRSAALVCLGLTALDDRTLGYLADHPSLLERIYERSATAFGAFSSSLQIEGNRVVPPGSLRQAQGERDDVVALWEGVVGEKVTRPEAFILRLLELNEGRLGLLYETLDQLDPARRAPLTGAAPAGMHRLMRAVPLACCREDA